MSNTNKSLVMVVLMALLLSACVVPTPVQEAPAAEDADADELFRVAVIMPSTINDLAISPMVSPGIRYIACPGMDAIAPTPAVYYYDLGGLVPAWRDAVD